MAGSLKRDLIERVYIPKVPPRLLIVKALRIEGATSVPGDLGFKVSASGF